VFTKRVHVFKAGPQTSAQGVEREFTPEDLQQVVESYDPETHEAPLVIGHSGDNDSTPSFGWIKKFVRKGEDLYADVNFTDVARDLVKDGHYRKVSISFYSPESPINPHQGKWSARHLALLGAAPPAVKGLESLSFSEKEGVYNFATSLSPEEIFDKDLGPTLILERSPLEVLRERLQGFRGEMDAAVQELKESQSQQTETEVGGEENVPVDGNTTPENPDQQFSEKKMKKKMGLEGAEVSESAQKLANLETMAPADFLEEEDFEEGTRRKVAKGAHGQKVQVVQEVFEETDELPAALRKNAMRMKAKSHKKTMKDEDEMEMDYDDHLEEDFEEGTRRKVAKGAHGQKVQVVQEVFEETDELPAALRKKTKSRVQVEEDEDEDEYAEISRKVTKGGKVSFEKTPAKDLSDPAGRSQTASSSEDSHGRRQKSGKTQVKDREALASSPDVDRDRLASSPDVDRDRLASSPDVDRDRLAKFAEEEDEDFGELPPALRKRAEAMRAKARIHDEDEDFREVPRKATREGKVSFERVEERHAGDPAGRGQTARSSDDSYGSRQKVGKTKAEDREDLASAPDVNREKLARSSEQDLDRQKLAKSVGDEGDNESRWADQPSGNSLTKNSDQFEDEFKDYPKRNRPGISDGSDPYGRDGGPTPVSELSEEEPDSLEIAVPLKSTKGNKTARVLHTVAGQGRSPVKGGPIVDHSEESDGVTRKPKKAKVSDGNDPYGRDGGPTEFPSRSEEDPDDLELAVDLEDSTQSDKVRIIRQKSGDMPTTDYDEDISDEEVEEFLSLMFEERDPMTKTGKGSTYGQKRPRISEDEDEDFDFEDEDFDFNEDDEDFDFEDDDEDFEEDDFEEDDEDFEEDDFEEDDEDFEDEDFEEDDEDFEDEEEQDFSETEDFCGMGSMGQPPAMGFPQQMYEEFMNLKAENERLRKEYEQQRVRSRKERIAQFVDSLYTEGKLTDGIIPQREFQSYCEKLETGTLDFAEGETPTSKLFEMLNRLPNLVYFGEVVSEGAYQAPEETETDPHQRALKMVANGEASDYVEAIKRCLSWNG
jgi:hypothetical protein